MNKTEETEFLKLFKCCTESGTETLCAFAKSKLLSGYGDDFKKFLEDKRHYFYHQWITKQVACCDCPPAGCSIRKSHKMENWIFRKLYSDTGNEDPKHVIKTGGYLGQICIHKYVVNNIQIDELDISLLYNLLCYNATLSLSEKNALDTLNSIRVQLSHASSTKYFPAAKLNDMWLDFERAILDITLPSYHKILERQIQFHKFYVLNSEDTVKLRREMEKITSEIKDVKGIHSENNNCILNHIDKSGDGIKRHVAEETAKSQRELLFQLQDLKSEVTDIVRREVLETKITHQIKNLVFKVGCTKPANILDPKKIVQEENERAVLFQIETPKGFDFDSVKVQKDSFNGENIKVKFVRRGSLIMMTTIPASVLYDDRVFEAAVKSFLTRLVEVCKIDTDKVCELEVTLHVLTDNEVDFSFKIQPTAQQIQREDKATQVERKLFLARSLKLSLCEKEFEKEMTRLQNEFDSKEEEILRLTQENIRLTQENIGLKQGMSKMSSYLTGER